MARQIKIFVSMPFGRSSEEQKRWNTLFKRLVTPIQRHNDAPQSFSFHRADQNISHLELKENVGRAIRGCDVFLGVLSTAKNTLIELGYAEALGKPSVLIGDHGASQEYAPIIAGRPRLISFNYAELIDTGASSGSTKFSELSNQLKLLLIQAAQGSRSKLAATQTYSASVYSNPGLADLGNLIRSAVDTVDILSVSVEWLVQSEAWDPLSSTKHPLREALDRGAHVRILGMNPDTVVAGYRAQQLGMTQAPYRHGLSRSIRVLNRQFNDYGDRFHLRLYDELPLQVTTLVDDVLVTTVISRGTRIRNAIHFQVQKDSIGVAETFLSHFNGLYDSSIDASTVDWVTAEEEVRISQAPSVVVPEHIGTGHFDVFLCHTSSQASEVQDIAHALRARGINPWLDSWQLPPGNFLDAELSKVQDHMQSAAVFVGSEGNEPWHYCPVKSRIESAG